MLATDQLLTGIYSVLVPLALIPGLWIAGRIVRRAGPWLARPRGLPGGAGRLPSLVLWLALGGLFASPVIDIADLLRTISLVLAASSEQPRFSILWGAAPFRLHFSLTTILLLVSYGLGIWAGGALLAALRGRLSPDYQPAAIEKAFFLLAVGSMASNFTKILVIGILGLQVPALYGILYEIGLYGRAGYAAGWALAMLTLVLAILVIGSRLPIIQDRKMP
jgi:hypothetical protein